MFFTWTKQKQVVCCLKHIIKIFFLFTLFSFWIIPQIFFFQHGRQDFVCWLVEKTRDRDRLSSNNGERCLLHVAARYGQVGSTILYQNQNIVSLSVQMVSYRKMSLIITYQQAVFSFTAKSNTSTFTKIIRDSLWSRKCVQAKSRMAHTIRFNLQCLRTSIFCLTLLVRG